MVWCTLKADSGWYEDSHYLLSTDVLLINLRINTYCFESSPSRVSNDPIDFPPVVGQRYTHTHYPGETVVSAQSDTLIDSVVLNRKAKSSCSYGWGLYIQDLFPTTNECSSFKLPLPVLAALHLLTEIEALAYYNNSLVI